VVKDNGLSISYDTKELNEFFPHLMEEIEHKKQTLRIDAVNQNESINEKVRNYEENLSNPGVIDFIRRCKAKEDAMEILEYLYMRKEIQTNLYEELKKKISEEDGLASLVEECGGVKTPGYYEKKYYKN
jgi:hypothetical protein